MDKQTFIAQCERGIAALPNNPVSAAVLRSLVESLKAGEPEWWKLTLKAWEGRRFGAWSEAWGLFLTAMHYEALSDEECELAPFFPSCGGTDEADPASGVARFLRDAPDSFYEHLKYGHRRVYEPTLSAIWAMLAEMFFRTRDLPYYVVESGAGGGLNLVADWYLPKFESELISARIGLDERPLVMEDLNDRRWATAAVPPDSSQAVATLDKVVERMLDQQGRDPNFLQLVKCAPEKAARFIAKNIPADDDGVGLLAFNLGLTSRMEDADYARYRSEMHQLIKTWNGRALWVEIEGVRGELFSTTLEGRITRLVDGAPVERVVFRYDTLARTAPDFQATREFLSPDFDAKAPAPARPT